jgi:hypothetical protein
MTELKDVIRCTEQNRRIKEESIEDINTLLDRLAKAGMYDIIESYMERLSPEIFPDYERHRARLDLALASTA